MKYQIELKNICKTYGALKANHKVNLQIKPASIHALLGENGAGKSTLVNIIYGLVRKDTGDIFWQDELCEIHSPVEARTMGIGIVFQHFALFEALSVTENIALGIDYQSNLKNLKAHIAQIGERYKLDINPNTTIAELSAGEKQRVEIIRCLLQEPKLLILDEPTSVLTPMETEHLFTTLRALQKDGCSVLFIGHKLDEIRSICEEATILRHGEFVDHCQLAGMSVAELAQMMVGSKVSEYSKPSQTKACHPVLTLNHNADERAASGHRFSVDKLELKTSTITGIAGIAGNGQDVLLSFMAGELKHRAQNILFNGQPIGHWSIDKRNQAGILFVPTERLGRSTVTQMSLQENVLLGVANKSLFVKNHLVNYVELNNFADEIITRFSVKTDGHLALASSLSGGNLQKFIVGRTILQNPKILLIANPTWGVDIQAAIFIRNQILKLRDQGVAILVASEDLDEMFNICDEIAVIKEGNLTEAQSVSDLTIEQIGLLMTE